MPSQAHDMTEHWSPAISDVAIGECCVGYIACSAISRAERWHKIAVQLLHPHDQTGYLIDAPTVSAMSGNRYRIV